jgi:hypothetical protein
MAKKERFSRDIVQCRHCRNRGRMQIAAEYDQIERDDRYGYEGGPVWELLRCSACGDVTLRKVSWHDGMESEDIDWRVIYPRDSSGSPKGLPAKIAAAWEAAHEVRRTNANAYAVLARRVMEMVVQDRGASGKDLNDQLRDLATKGTIPGPLADMAHHVRFFGNAGAHADVRDLTQNEAALVHDLCAAVLEYVYTAPRLVARAQGALRKYRDDNNAEGVATDAT